MLNALSLNGNLTVREAFTARHVLQNLSGIQLVILGDLISLADVSNEVLQGALDKSCIPVVMQEGFVSDPAE